MKRLLAVLLLTALQLAEVVYSQPFRVTGARISPTGSILVWGELSANNTTLPLVAVMDATGQIHDAFYLVAVNSRIVVLDALEEEGEIVVGGLIERGGRREAFASKLSSRAVDWALLFQRGPYFIRTIAKRKDGYALLGLASGVSDSDIAIIYINANVTIEKAFRIGSPMYDDFIERAYDAEGSLLIAGSTWCQNVSYVDALVINVTEDSLHLLTVGGADRDEGIAARLLDGKIVLVGSTFTSRGGLSDAYLAVVSGADLKVLSLGWQSYDGFVDTCGSLVDLFLLGYATIEGKNVGLLVRANEKEVISGLLIECDMSIIPLAIGLEEGKLITVFKTSDALLSVTFDPDLRPLKAFTVGGLNLTTVKVKNIADVGKRIYDVNDMWRIQQLKLSPTPIDVSERTLNLEIHPLKLDSRPLSIEIEVEKYTERIPLARLLLQAIEQNIPLVIILIPILAVILVIITAKWLR